MAFIYKITNKINGKVYIGKTERTIEIRWKEHQKNAKYEEKLFHIPLYKAFNKYGIENFSIEYIEECATNILNEREQYWIKFFDSCGNGYNCTLGGDGSLLLFSEEEIQEIIKRHQNGERLDYLCKEFHHDYMTIKRLFNERGIEIKTNAGPMKNAKSIYAIDPITLTVVAEYESISAAGRALCQEGKNPRAISNHISKYKDTATISHGYLWKTSIYK